MWETHRGQFYRLHGAVKAVVEISDPEFPFAFTPEQLGPLLNAIEKGAENVRRR